VLKLRFALSNFVFHLRTERRRDQGGEAAFRCWPLCDRHEPPSRRKSGYTSDTKEHKNSPADRFMMNVIVRNADNTLQL
jgi:hypothetical protein